MNPNRPVTSRDVVRGLLESPIARSETNDCVVRAFAVFVDLPYDEAHSEVCVCMKRRPRKGVSSLNIIAYFRANPDRFELVATETCQHSPRWSAADIIVGNTLKSTYQTKNGELKCAMTVGTFAKRYNKGRYFLCVRGHCFSIVDGVIVGNASDTRKKRTIVKWAFRVK